MKYEQGSSAGILAMIGDHRSVCRAIAFIAILHATLKRGNASFSVIHSDDTYFALSSHVVVSILK